MSANPLLFATNTITSVIHCLNRRYYKQQLLDIQRFVSSGGFDCERHLYKCLFEATFAELNLQQQLQSNTINNNQTTSGNQRSSDLNSDRRSSIGTGGATSGSARLHLLQQLYIDLGDLFQKPHFVTLIQYAFQSFSAANITTSSLTSLVTATDKPDASTSFTGRTNKRTSQSKQRRKPSATVSADSDKEDDDQTSVESKQQLPLSVQAAIAFDSSSNPELRDNIVRLCSCLQLTEVQKLALIFSLNALDLLDQLIDLPQCSFSSHTLLSHNLLTQQHLLPNNPKAIEITRFIKEELRIGYPLEASNSAAAILNAAFAENHSEMDSGATVTSVNLLNCEQIVNLCFTPDNRLSLNNDLLKQFSITPRLLARFLLNICDAATELTITNRTSLDDIEQLAHLSHERLNYGGGQPPIQQIIQAIDSEEMLMLTNKFTASNKSPSNKISPAFQCFWQFCLSISSLDKMVNSGQLIGQLFFTKIWSFNLDFQFGVICNFIRGQLLNKLLGSQTTSANSNSVGSQQSEALGVLVPNIENLKAQPDYETHPEAHSWKYQRVYQILMELSVGSGSVSTANAVAGGGQPTLFYGQIVDLFKWPIQYCPDLVVLGLLGVIVNPCMCKNELLGQTIPVFLSNHVNAAIILHTIWNSAEQMQLGSGPLGGSHQHSGQWAKQVLLQSMCEYYMKSQPDDQSSRLSRILDVANDLKALSLLINSNCYPFVIDFACLASRRDYLKLEKWLLEKIHNNGEPFIQACIQFLSRRCPFLLNGTLKGLDANQQQQNPVGQLHADTLATMLACLGQHVSNLAGQQNKLMSNCQPLSQELTETILTMIANSQLLRQKMSARLQPLGAGKSTCSNAVGSTTGQPSVVAGQPPSVQQAAPAASLVPGINSVSATANLADLSLAQLSLSGNASAANFVVQNMQRAAFSGTQQQRQQAAFTQQQQPDSQQSVSPEIEREVNANFQRIYNQNAADHMSVEQVLEMLKCYQDSPDKREREIFSCMIKNLLDEYRFYPQYPERELQITARLFGGIIQHDLIKYVPLVMALRYVLEALKKPSTNNMFHFGIIALDRFRTKLKEYPLYCHHLSTLPHFHEFPPVLAEFINHGKNSQYPPSINGTNLASAQAAITGSGQAAAAMNRLNRLSSSDNSSAAPSLAALNARQAFATDQMVLNDQLALSGQLAGVPVSGISSQKAGGVGLGTATKPPVSSVSSIISNVATSSASVRSGAPPSIANASNIDILLAAGDTCQTPSEAIQDRIAFIINNLSQLNLQQKTDEFREAIGNDELYNGWIAQYFVMKRVSIEPNFHNLYSNFIEVLKMSELTKVVLRETYRNINVLLRSNKEAANFSDRSLLKNLGHWLGLLTVARNRPILAIDLNLKYLLIEAYHKGMQELLYVVPFIAKVLESCAKSKVFRPPNPWTMSIVKVLIELHQEPKLKLNLRFEVEVLSKTLSIDINEWIGKSNLLKDEQVLARVMAEQQLANPEPVVTISSQQPCVQTAQQQQQSAAVPIPTSQQQLASVSQLPTAVVGSSSSVGSGTMIHSAQLPVGSLNSQNFANAVSSTSAVVQRAGVLAAAASVHHQQQQSNLGPDAQILAAAAASVHAGGSPSTAINAFAAAVAAQNPNTSINTPFAASHGAVGMPSSVSAVSAESAATLPSRLFNYADINVLNPQTMHSQVYLQPGLTLLQVIPTLRQWIRPAIEKAINDLMPQTVDRSVKATVVAAEQIVKKDFGIESDEQKMCLAAQCLVRSLASGIAMFSCKDPLFVQLKQALIAAFTTATAGNATKDLIEATAQTIAADNIDLICAYIQKTTAEKAILELDKRMAPEYEQRRKLRQEGRRYIDLNSASIQERLPEQIRIKSPLTSAQFAIYEELAANIPGFASTSTSQNPLLLSSALNGPQAVGPQAIHAGQTPQQITQQIQINSRIAAANQGIKLPISTPVGFGSGQQEPNQVDAIFLALFEKLLPELETLLQQFVNTMQPSKLCSSVHAVYEIVVAVRGNPNDQMAVINLVQKLLDALGELMSSADNANDLSLLTRARDLYMMVLKGLADSQMYGQSWVSKQVTRITLDRLLINNSQTTPLPDDRFDLFMRAGLINVPLFDYHLVSLFENATNPVALTFALQFIKFYGQSIQESDVPNILCALVKLSKDSMSTLAIEVRQLLENCFRPATVRTYENFSDRIGRQFNTTLTNLNQFSIEPQDSQEFVEKTEKLLREWINLYNSPTNLNKVFNHYVQQMDQQGILKTDDSISRFCRISTELCVNLCYRLLSTQQPSPQSVVDVRNKCFYTLDAFAHLIVMLVKHSGTNIGAALESSAKLNLLSKVLVIISSVALQDQNSRNGNFQHLPYFRIFIILFMELMLGPNNLSQPTSQGLQQQLCFPTSPQQADSFSETIHYQVLAAFCQALRMIKPSKAPSFAFAWLDFISHRTFMDKCLNGPSNSSNASAVSSSVGGLPPIGGAGTIANSQQVVNAGLVNSSNNGVSTCTKGWPYYAQLLIELLKFEAPFLRNVELPHSMNLLYKGTLKVLLVLLHDFPEFLCEYCYELCDIIPPNAIQMRNLVLSAFPRQMRLPDPFTPNLKIDVLPEITMPQKTSPSSFAALASAFFKNDLDSYLHSRSPVTFLSKLRGYLQTSSAANSTNATSSNTSDSGVQSGDPCKYNIPLINALVLYVGQKAILSLNSKNINMSTIAHSAHMDVFQNLAVDLDTEGRYLFLNAITNQLRYPNSNTHYFSCILLYLFAEANSEVIQEQITRVLLERLIVIRPHPWGILVTFIELIKNSVFKFWHHEYVRCAPEIEKLFESVARSCMQPKKTLNAIQSSADAISHPTPA